MYNYRPPYENELYHYGVIGMKWGVRRYQNPDGTLTEAGKQQYSRKEVRADNKEAFEKGKIATAFDRAARIAEKKALKAAYRSEKAPNNSRRLDKKNITEATAKELRREADKTLQQAKDHINSLKEKYGDEHVKDLKYNKKGMLNERVSNGKDWAENALVTAGGTALGAVLLPALGSPVAMYIISTPATANDYGRAIYKDTYRDQKKQYKSNP